jgi:hypothetical protein
MGQLVLLHQTQGDTGNVGQYEYARVASASGSTVTLSTAATSSYLTDATHKAQILEVPEYTNVTVSMGGTLTAPAWNGTTGGILAVNASNVITVAGTITMSGNGFRGTSHASCPARITCSAGTQGESHLGVGLASFTANGPGGGGGSQGQDSACGAGGSYATVGSAGMDGYLCGACALDCVGGATVGGSAGTTAGTADLSGSILFGAAGGEGGADEDGDWPGPGGNGGGIILLKGLSITVTGSITSNGATGGNGESSPAAGCGDGCGMGGGGGGAGGAIRILVSSASTLGTDLIAAAGAGGGVDTCGGAKQGGTGGFGRIGIKALSVTGSTNPPYDAN